MTSTVTPQNPGRKQKGQDKKNPSERTNSCPEMDKKKEKKRTRMNPSKGKFKETEESLYIPWKKIPRKGTEQP